MTKLDDWKMMWEKEGFKMVELDNKEKANERWLLFSIHCPYDAEEYGRHLGALLVIDKTTGQIMKHDTTNQWVGGTANGPTTNPSREIYEWFNRHVKDGLGGLA